jgi:branched-subunit amino acid transport protein
MPGQLVPLILAIVVGVIVYLALHSLLWAVVIGLVVFVANTYWIGRPPNG